jgi:UDPglucose 6-dehydrogenase
MSDIAVLGLGYVGITSLVGLAKLGHNVLGLDTNSKKVSSLRQGYIPIHEPGLKEVYGEELSSGRIQFSTT